MSKIRRKYPLIATTAFLAVVITTQLLGVVINITPSMKEGVYTKAKGKIETGDVVSFCLNNPYQQLGLERHYLESGHKCNGTDPLIKQVIAIPGDDVVLTDDAIEVDGVRYFYKTSHEDSFRRSLAVYPRGNYLNTSGYWLIGTHAMNSWDSRYWGPISKDQILEKVRPVLTW